MLQILRTLWFFLQHFRSSQRSGERSGSLGGGEDKAACFIFEIFDNHLAGAGVTAFGAKCFTERTHENVRADGVAEMLNGAVTCFADNAGGMCFVNHREQMIFFAEGDESRQINNITVHAENCVADNQTSAAGGSKNFRFQVLHIIMLIDNNACFRKTCAVDDAGVIVFVAEDNAFTVAEGGNNADVGHVTCVED